MILPYDSTLWFCPMNLPYASTLWFCPMNLPYDSTLWFYPKILPYDSTLWFCPMILPYDSALWIYPMILPFKSTLWFYSIFVVVTLLALYLPSPLVNVRIQTKINLWFHIGYVSVPPPLPHVFVPMLGVCPCVCAPTCPNNQKNQDARIIE